MRRPCAAVTVPAVSHANWFHADPDLGSCLAEAAELLQTMSNPARLQLLQAAVDRGGDARECTLDDLAEVTGRGVRDLVQDVVRLQRPGLLRVRGQRVRADLGVLSAAAQRAEALHPVSTLLADDPDLSRFFRHGRLMIMPEDRAVQRRVAALVVRLLPADTELTEVEVNRCLGQVHDHATLRRLLVDEGLLERGASQSYRVVRAGEGASHTEH